MDAEDRNKQPKPELDEITLQLRDEFALLDKIIELQKLAKGHPNAKQSRKASKAAAKAAIKANKQAGKGPWSLKAPKAKQPAVASKWIEKVCWRCKSKFTQIGNALQPFARFAQRIWIRPTCRQALITQPHLLASTSSGVGLQAWASDAD
ncbi:hypothetical protein [Pseudomonas putida]|uniref:hypothetical protein n=1 Tax=Pseudomonas putida TaxID=303 RepID=UPI0031334B63